MARNATLTILLGVLAAAAVMLALGGCSGAGSGTPAASGASVSAVVTDQLTGALTVRRWLNVMYRGQGGSGVKPAAVKPALAKSGQVGPRQTIAFEDSGTNSDGSSDADHTCSH